MLAKAAYSLLPPPKEEIRLQHNLRQSDRPHVVIVNLTDELPTQEEQDDIPVDVYRRPEDVPFEVAAKMGFRCAKCGALSLPVHDTCIDCGNAKRSDWGGKPGSYQGLLHVLDVIREPALTTVVDHEVNDGVKYRITYRRTINDTILTTREKEDAIPSFEMDTQDDESYRVLISRHTSRFGNIVH
jgi:hypothetical protein